MKGFDQKHATPPSRVLSPVSAAVPVQALGADWVVASGHKMCAPTGAGFI